MQKKLKRHHQFEKNFKKRIASNQKLSSQFEARLKLYLQGERGGPINDHALTGKLVGMRAFSISGDTRVIYIETDTDIIFIDIGSHSQVYGK